ncbi:MAG: cation:proton antiporter [Gemmatimonadetes bacterium]|nr:cation:proton antiporter [Gemmatimonadota bacterium]
MSQTLLTDIVIILGLSLVVSLVFHRVRVPVIIGFLFTGVLAGPHGLGLVRGVHEVELLAEVGVILLLFTIGIEFSLRNLLRMARSVFVGGALQVLLTTAVVFVIARAFGQEVRHAVFLGFLVSLSSTAIVLKLLQDRAEISAPHGQTSMAVLVFQDMAVVPMMLLTPFLAAQQGELAGPLMNLLLKGAGIVVVVVVAARWVVPWVLDQVVRTGSREVFLLSTVLFGLGAAWFSSLAGLSLALGAFLAGLVISESEYSAQALSEILPFKNLFISFFFVSIGMLLDLGFLFKEPLLVASITLAVIGIKTVVGALVVLLLGFPLRIAVMVGLALSQLGEFSFILSETGVAIGLLAGANHQIFLAVCVLTMALTPFLVSAGAGLAERVTALPLPEKLLRGGKLPTAFPDEEQLRDHLIVVGFGVNGRNVSKSAQLAGIPHVVVDLAPELVRQARESGATVLFGDATQPAVLKHAGVERARILVTAISDPAGTRRIVALARGMNPALQIIVRTRYVGEVEELVRVGADEVIPEEFETSVEILARVLRRYLIPRYEIDQLVAEVRSGGYEILRSFHTARTQMSDVPVHLPDTEVATVHLTERSYLVGRTLREAGLREEYNVILLALCRGGETITNPAPDTMFQDGDMLIVFGRSEEIADAVAVARGADTWND